MTISLFLIFFYVVLACFTLFSLFIVYHLFRYGFADFENYFMIIIYVLVAILIIFTTMTFVSDVDWSLPIFSVSSSPFTF